MSQLVILTLSSEEEEEEGKEEEEDSEEGEEEEGKPTLRLSGCESFVWEREDRVRDGDEVASGEDEEEEAGKEVREGALEVWPPLLLVSLFQIVSSKKSRRQKKAALKAEEEQLYQVMYSFSE